MRGWARVSMWRDFPARLAARAGCGALVVLPPRPRQLRSRAAAAPAGFSGDAWARCFAGAAGAARAWAISSCRAQRRRHDRAHLSRGGHRGGGADRRGAACAGRAADLARHRRAARALARRQAARAFGAPPSRSRRRTFEGGPANGSRPDSATGRSCRSCCGHHLACRSSRCRARTIVYGSMRQIDEIANHRRRPGRGWRSSSDCGHDPFRDAPRRMLDLCAAFVSRVCETA